MDRQKIEALWTHLHWLTVLAQQASFTAAAARLGVSKAAMSQRIADLESAAGVPLVQRTTRSVRLTEAGERLVAQTQGPFQAIEDSFEGVRELAGEPQGVLRVTAPVEFARQQLIARMPAFLDAHPRLRVALDLSDQLRNLPVEGFDLAIRHVAQPPETHVAWNLCQTRSLLVASPGYLARRGRPSQPSDLADHACLHYPRERSLATWTFLPVRGTRRASRADTATARIASDPVTVAVAGPLEVNNSEALRDAALSGMGIALVPDFSAQAALRSRRLVEVLPAWQPVGAFADKLFAVRPYASHVPPSVRAFVAFLRDAFRGGFSVG